ncbi:MAG: hypothetical protein Kow0092_22230 [Deferrisomatales bacterium]
MDRRASCDSPPVSHVEELSLYARGAAEAFAADAETAGAPFSVGCRVHRTRAALAEHLPGARNRPACAVRTGRSATVHLSFEDLQGIPRLALEGWVELLLAECAVGARLGPAPFNFRKEILPFFPVSGSAVLFLRDLVEQIHRALVRHLATQDLVRMGRIASQICYYRYRLEGGEAEGSAYADTLPHDWIRALFLSRTVKEYAILRLLAETGAERARALQVLWESGAPFVARDRRILEDMVDALTRSMGAPYSRRVSALFQVVARRLLRRPAAGAPREPVH